MRSIQTKWFVLFGSVTALWGCTATYTPKPNEAQARLRVITLPVTKSPSGVVWSSRLSASDLSNCPGKSTTVIRTGEISTQNAHSLGMPSPSDSSSLSAEFALPAGRPLAFAFGMSTQLGRQAFTCYVQVQFTPVPGRDYEVQYAVNERSETCYAPVQELRQARAGVQRVPVAGVRQWDPKRACDAGRPVTR